ncbi:MAG: glutamate--tRNA ligase [Candidatus Woesearchaeota archaeon]
MKAEILKFALQNAVQFNGKANPGAVIGKIIPLLSDKSKIPSVSKEVAAIVKEVNSLKLEEQKAKLAKLAPEMLEKKKGERRKLPPLKNAVKGKVVTRIPPEPSKYPHVGHALSFLINYIYAKEYYGRSILRFDDTNPMLAKKEYAEAIIEDLKFLQIKPDATVYASNDLPKMYACAERLIKSGHAYICFCDREEMQQMRHEGHECTCRMKKIEKDLEEWKKMLRGEYQEGEAVLRLKANMKAGNYVMRDPVIFRINYAPHFLQGTKYKVWPMYDFESAYEDGTLGVTHIFRSIEFGEMRIELQNRIQELLGLPRQTIVQYGRFNIVGSITRGRLIREMIDKGEMAGWDDPRLVTIRALKRRGIQPETFKEFAIEVGLSATQTNIDWTVIAAINRKILDPISGRYFFVKNPKKIIVKGAPKRNIELKLHPEREQKERKFSVGENFYIAENDFNEIREKDLIRLMDCLNFRKKGKEFVFDSLEVEKYRSGGKSIIQWLPADATVQAEILMPDASVARGLAEKNIESVKVGEVVQFVRFGFCRLEKKEKDKFSFIYTHN